MKKLLFLIFSFTLTIQFAYSMSDRTVILEMTEDGEYGEETDKTNRMPSMSETCVIDFANLTILTERIPMVISYELWDEAGKTTVASYSTDFELVTLMSSLTGRYQLRLVTEECTYIGYLEL